ncbi:MAG: hypothetical protein JW754_03950 [Candidatus Aenigmarchaeota archaeon]|nr:hypothetical protein [Candidatus Aenigmarchaeota archaeon]
MIQFIEGLKEIPFVESVSGSGEEGYNSYYGMNVSPKITKEPVDQLDGFIVAKYLQKETGSKFYPFIAGVYGALNSKNPKQAAETARSKSLADMKKRELLRNVMSNMGLDGKVYVTYDLWDDEFYWEIFREIARSLEPFEIQERVPNSGKGMRMNEYPLRTLGKMQSVIKNGFLDEWFSSGLYIPAEVTEAVWFKERKGVNFKIGPMESESIYDDIISENGIGIIGLEQPEYMAKATSDGNGGIVPAQVRKTVPYIGKSGQNRVFFSDNIADIAIFRMLDGDPSFQRAVTLAECYGAISGKGKSSKSYPEKVYELVKLGGGGL